MSFITQTSGLITFTLIIFINAPLLAADNTGSEGRCPTETEWHGLKTRSFFNKLFVAATTCRSYKSDMQSRNDQVREKLTTTYRTYYIEQIRLASSYYDRIGGTRSQTSRPSSSEDYGQNQEWDRNETRNLNLYSLQSVQLSTQNRTAFQAYCQQADETLTRLQNVSSVQSLDEIAISHPYSREHNLTDCDASGRIVTDPAISQAAETEDASPSAQSTEVQITEAQTAESESTGSERQGPISLLPASYETATDRPSSTNAAIRQLMNSTTQLGTVRDLSSSPCIGHVQKIGNVNYCVPIPPEETEPTDTPEDTPILDEETLREED